MNTQENNIVAKAKSLGFEITNQIRNERDLLKSAEEYIKSKPETAQGKTRPERYTHDNCPECGNVSVAAENVPDQALRGCPKCGEQWLENLDRPPNKAQHSPQDERVLNASAKVRGPIHLPSQSDIESAQHSPLPWTTQIDERGKGCTILDASRGIVARCDDGQGKLIVRAVNHADKLAEALRDFLKVVRTSNIDRSATHEGLTNCDAISVASAKLAAYEAAK